MNYQVEGLRSLYKFNHSVIPSWQGQKYQNVRDEGMFFAVVIQLVGSWLSWDCMSKKKMRRKTGFTIVFLLVELLTTGKK